MKNPAISTILIGTILKKCVAVVNVVSILYGPNLFKDFINNLCSCVVCAQESKEF